MICTLKMKIGAGARTRDGVSECRVEGSQDVLTDFRKYVGTSGFCMRYLLKYEHTGGKTWLISYCCGSFSNGSSDL